MKDPYGVLLLHGFAASLDCVKGVELRIQEQALPEITPTLRGHGAGSPEALRGVVWRDWVSDAEAALDDLGKDAEKVIVVGYSMGGLVALNLAADHRNVVDSIILAATAIEMATPFAADHPLHPLLPLVAHLRARQPMPSHAGTDSVYFPWAPASAYAELLEFAEATRRRLPEVYVPALILQGRKDSVVAPQSADIIFDGIATPAWDKRVLWFENTDHIIFCDCERDAATLAVVSYVRERAGLRSPAEQEHDELVGQLWGVK
jgi:carboxylesterase